MGLGALALVVGLTVVQVGTAEELLMAIGPQRTVRLSAGTYDLSAVKPRELAFVKWASSGNPPGITVHDVDGLTIEGPAEGEARLTTGSGLRLAFEAMGGLTLRRIGIGRGADELLPHYRIEGEYMDLTLRNVDTLLFEDVRWSRGSVHQFVIDGARHAVLRRVDLGMDSPVALESAADLRIEDSWLRPDAYAISVGKVSDVVLANTTIFAPMRPSVTLEELLPTRGDATVGIVNVRLVDEASGKLRRTFTAPAFHLTSVQSTQDPLELPFLIVRRGPWSAASAEPTKTALIRLEDGREPMKDFPSSARSGLDPSSVYVQRLGTGSGPIAVSWGTMREGNGSYSDGYYRILAGRPGGGLLLAGAYGASGSTGAVSGGTEWRTVAFENGLLTVRGSSSGIYGHGPPGLPAEQSDKEGTVFLSESYNAYELIYRVDGERVIPVRYEEYQRIEPRTDVAAMIAGGARPSWPHLDGTLPRVGEWLKTIVPLKEGARKYPTIDLSDPFQP